VIGRRFFAWKEIALVFSWQNNYLKKLERKVGEIWKLGPEFKDLKESNEFIQRSRELRSRADELRGSTKEDKILNDLLPRAYALVCEAIRYTMKMDPYDQQIMGAIALHEGRIVEMENGEGKTLMATLPAYLNSLTRQRVHISTDNDYLALRDAQWMAPIYATLGTSVGVVLPGNSYKVEQDATGRYIPVPCPRKTAYACDITYGTHVDFAFDYLKDNMVTQQQDIVIGDHLDYIILDEADSVLIDRARTPLRETEPLPFASDWYRTIMDVAQQLDQSADYLGSIAGGQNFAHLELTDSGTDHAELLLQDAGVLDRGSRLYDIKNAGVADQILQSLYAIHFYKLDHDYIIEDELVTPIDQTTGRRLKGGTLGNGIHQAVQAKEHLEITSEDSPLAEISYQHFFKLYKKMAGMTATARERAAELLSVYTKQVVKIPPHKESPRHDETDRIYRTSAGRLNAVLDEIEEKHRQGRPVLVNTHEVKEADELGRLLREREIACEVLHAKYHAREAAIIEEAGKEGKVTVSAKMAGRGTDIRIEDKAVKQGGLHVIGVERNMSRYMDRQLIGRAGRQGNPGSSCFFLSLEDKLLVRFAVQWVARVMERTGMDEDMALESATVARFIRMAQEKIEEYNFALRQQAYEFDSVLDKQRQLIYAIRRKAVLQEDLSQDIQVIIENLVVRSMSRYLKGKRYNGRWDIGGLAKFFVYLSPQRFSQESFSDTARHDWDDIKDWLGKNITIEYELQKKRAREASGEDIAMMQYERRLLMQLIDEGWRAHLTRLQDLQEQLFLRSYVEENGLEWYSQESYKAFQEMLERIEIGFLKSIFTATF
jgi:preprotein translocase subunit SecA